MPSQRYPGPSRRPPRAALRGRASGPAFENFFERDASRARRRRGRNRIIVASVAIHVIAFTLLLVLSFWEVDELPGPSVDVKMFAPGQVPARVLRKSEP